MEVVVVMVEVVWVEAIVVEVGKAVVEKVAVVTGMAMRVVEVVEEAVMKAEENWAGVMKEEVE